jgi:hypothetical protein
MSHNSNRLFSSFLSSEEMRNVEFRSYFPVLRKERTVSLLPSDHALYYPLEFNPDTGEVIRGETNFFNSILYSNYKTGTAIPAERFSLAENAITNENALIINILDNCYGHSYLKLLNLVNIHESYAGRFDLWVITPSATAHFVPAEKFHIAEVRMGFNEAMKCYSLGPVVDAIKGKYKEVDYVTLDTYIGFNDKKSVRQFFGFPEVRDTRSRNQVTFYYRSDFFRTWNGRRQASNISNFFKAIRKYFDPAVTFAVVGDLDSVKFPNHIKDMRTNKFGEAVDREYNTIFANSIMVLGLIGSNMLQPSVLCDFTVHITPRSKVTIVAEEFLNARESSIRSWFNNVYIFGNEDCGDLKPAELAEKVILLYLTFLAKDYKLSIYEDVRFAERLSQGEYFDREYPMFKWREAAIQKDRVIQSSFTKTIWKYRLNRLLSAVKIQGK